MKKYRVIATLTTTIETTITAATPEEATEKVETLPVTRQGLAARPSDTDRSGNSFWAFYDGDPYAFDVDVSVFKVVDMTDEY